MWMKIKDYAKLMDCSEHHVRNLIKAGALEVRNISVTSRACYRIWVSSDLCRTEQ